MFKVQGMKADVILNEWLLVGNGGTDFLSKQPLHHPAKCSSLNGFFHSDFPSEQPARIRISITTPCDAYMRYRMSYQFFVIVSRVLRNIGAST